MTERESDVAPRFEPRPIESGFRSEGPVVRPRRNAARLLRAIGLLYFRPDRFVREFIMEPAPWVVALFAWSYGICGDAFTGRRTTFDSWVLEWIATALFGIVLGFVYYKLGGWWYRKRLSWSGATNVDRNLAKRVYLSTAQIEVLPSITWQLAQTIIYATPRAAVEAEEQPTLWNAALFLALAVVFPLWSCWASCLGVETAFTVRRGAARFWFFLLPLIGYGLAALAVAGVVLWGQ
jgi:hypothetical protein